MVALARIPAQMTVAEFLEWESGDSLRYELVDGEPRAMAPASVVHGLLQNELGRLIGNHLRGRGPDCDVVTNPGVIPGLMSALNMRVPDVAVTCSPVLPGQAAMPEPMLLIEVLSPGNRAQTWTNVWTYTSIPSVQEILVVHSDRVAAQVLRRAPDGGWPDQTEDLTAGELQLTSIRFRVPLGELYARTGLTP